MVEIVWYMCTYIDGIVAMERILFIIFAHITRNVRTNILPNNSCLICETYAQLTINH